MTNSNEQFNENMTLDEVEAKIEELNQLRVRIIQREVDKKKVIEHIKVQMMTYGITLDDLKIFETKEPQVEADKSTLHKAKQKTKKHIAAKTIPILTLNYVAPNSLFTHDSAAATTNIDTNSLATVTYEGTRIQPGFSSQITVDRFYCTNKNAQEFYIDVHPNTVSTFMEVIRRIYISQGNDGNIVKQIKLPVFNAFARPVSGKQFCDNFGSSGNVPSFTSGLRTRLPHGMPFIPPESDEQFNKCKAQFRFSDLRVFSPVESIIEETDFYFYLFNPVNKSNLLLSSLSNKPFETIIKDLEIYTEISFSEIFKQIGPYNQFTIQDGNFFICKDKLQDKFILVRVNHDDKKSFMNAFPSQTSEKK